MDVSWPQLIAFAGTSGVLSAAVTWLLGWIKDSLNNGREAAYLAIRLATVMEMFADQCLAVIGDFDTFRQSKGAAGSKTTRLPALATFPDDAGGWRALPAELIGRVLTFPNQIRASQDKVSFSASVSGGDAAWDDCEEECARLGLDACVIAADLRKRFGFAPFMARYDVARALGNEVAAWNQRRPSS